MVGIACPMCESQDYERYRAPRTMGKIVFRRHYCNNCRGIFLTAQMAVAGTAAERVLTMIEKAMPGSEPTLPPEDILATEDSPATTENVV